MRVGSQVKHFGKTEKKRIQVISSTMNEVGKVSSMGKRKNAA